MLPGAANFVASTSGVATSDTRESLYWVSPQGVRYGVAWDQRTLQALGLDPGVRCRRLGRSCAPSRPARRSIGTTALLARDTIDAGGAVAPIPELTNRTREARHVQTRLRPGSAQPPPTVPPARVVVAPPLALPEREPRNILLMIALPALLVGIIGTLVVMYTSGVRSLQSGFFPMIGLAGFGALMFSGRFGRGRRISLGRAGEAAPNLPAPARRGPRRSPARRAGPAPKPAVRARRSAETGHRHRRAADVGAPPGRSRISSMCAWVSAFSRPATRRCRCSGRRFPIGEELEPVTGGALRDFILEQSKIRGIGKVLSLRSKPGFSFIGSDPDELHTWRGRSCARWRSITARTTSSSWSSPVIPSCGRGWCGCRTTSMTRCSMPAGCAGWCSPSPIELEEALDAELHRKGRGPWTPPAGTEPDIDALADGVARGSALARTG